MTIEIATVEYCIWWKEITKSGTAGSWTFDKKMEGQTTFKGNEKEEYKNPAIA